MCNRILFVVGAFISIVAATPLQAQSVKDFYERTQVRLLVGSPVGGDYDTPARVIGRYIGNYIPGNPRIQVENMDGASGKRAANYLYNAAPKDGSVVAVLQATLPLDQVTGVDGVYFDAEKFNWIGNPVEVIDVATVWHTSGLKTIEDAKTREVIVGATSRTGISYAFPNLSNVLLGTKLKIVTGYNGSQGVMLAMERGEIQSYFSNPWSNWKFVKAEWVRDGKLIPIMQMGLGWIEDLPNVPRLVDLVPEGSGRQAVEIMGIVQNIGRPMLTAPGVPADRLKALRVAFDQTMNDKGFREDAARSGMMVKPVKGEEVQKEISHLLHESPDSINMLKDILNGTTN